MKIKKLNESGQTRSNRFNTYKKRIEKAIEKGDQETLQRTKEAIMYSPAKELKNSEAKELMDMIKGAKLEEALTGYKLTIVKDGETFDDYAAAYEEAGAVQQMKNKYGKDIEVKNVAVSKVIKEGTNWEQGSYNIYQDNKLLKKVSSRIEVAELLQTLSDSELNTIKVTRDNLQHDYRETEDEVTKIHLDKELRRRGIKEFKSVKEDYRGRDNLYDIIFWLQDHEQAWDEFCVDFKDVEDYDLTYSMIVDWLYEHEDLYDAFLSRFGDDLDECKSIREELWDSARVIDLVNYYLDRGNPEINTLQDLIMKKMKEEGSSLPTNITDFTDALYRAVDQYNSQFDDEEGLDESTSIKTFGAKGKKLHESNPAELTDCPECGDISFDSKKGRCTKCSYRESFIPDDAEYERIDRSGSDEERLVAAVSYMYGVDTDTAKEYIPDLGDTQRKKALAYYDLRDLPRDVRLAKIKELYPRVRESFSGKYGKVTYEKRADGLDGQTAHYAGYHLFSNGNEYTPYWAGETAMGSSYASIEDAVKGIDSYIDKQKSAGKLNFLKPVNESIEVATIADYIVDHYDFDDIDDKYSCINSIRDSFKDEETISYEELEQFIGAHNGRDKVNEDIDYSKFRDIPDLIPYEPVEDTRKWQYSVGGVDVPYTSYEDAKAHLKDDYNIEDYREELQAYLDKETGRPQKFFVDATFDGRLVISIHWGDWKHEHNYADFLVRKFFMDKGLGIETDVDVTDEDGSDTYSAEHYYQINDIALSGRVIDESAATHCVYFTQDGRDQVEFEGTEDECNKYIKDIQAEQDDTFGDDAPERFIKKLTEEADVQYGVHQFSTDSIIFRGTEEECGKYIDKNKKLWDNAEVYRMTPDDPHYKKDLDEDVDKPLYIIKDSHGNQLSAPNPDDSELWDRVESMEARGRRGLMVVAYTGKKVNEASYGGAFDIEDDQYFTRDDLLYFADEVLGHVAETFNGQYDIGGVWFEDGCVVTQIVSEDGNMYEDTTKVDMRKIREPWHLTRMYAFPVAANIIKQISDTEGNVITENAIGQGEYSDKFHDYLFFLLNEGKEDNLPYLASQLIRYCKEEDLKDLWHDRMEQVAHSVGFEATDDELQEALKDESMMAQRYVDYEIPDLCKKVLDYIPNMTEGALISLNRHCLRWHSAVEDVLDMSGYYQQDSMTESLTDAEPIETGAAVGMAAVVSDLIKDEYEAIDGYNSAIATAEAEGFGDAVKVLTEIQAEENIHIGQLQEVMKMFDPNAEKVEEGQAEGAEQLNNSDETPNNNIEESADMKKERWEEIYDSFKTVEKELNQDGEAVTAVVDQMYQDNKEDPDYKKAYDKWASGN